MSAATVLVVEDDEDVREVVAFILRHAGHRVLEAQNGREALERMAAHGLPDLILLDMNMPVMNGWELAYELRARGLGRIPILVLTAAPDAQGSAEEIGAAGFVGKPFGMPELLRAVDGQLGGGAPRAPA